MGHRSSARASRSTPTATSSSAQTCWAAAAARPARTASTPRPDGRTAADFPAITVGDMVEVQRRLIDHLGIAELSNRDRGLAGWASSADVGDCGIPSASAVDALLATSPRLTSQALAFDVVGRNAILQRPDYRGGQYYKRGTGPVVGLALARMLGHITYLSREAMTAQIRSRSAAADGRPNGIREEVLGRLVSRPTRARSSSSALTPTAT